MTVAYIEIDDGDKESWRFSHCSMRHDTFMDHCLDNRCGQWSSRHLKEVHGRPDLAGELGRAERGHRLLAQ